jgi:hypothetical protein
MTVHMHSRQNLQDRMSHQKVMVERAVLEVA